MLVSLCRWSIDHAICHQPERMASLHQIHRPAWGIGQTIEPAPQGLSIVLLSCSVGTDNRQALDSGEGFGDY